jgi:hypothetical protein
VKKRAPADLEPESTHYRNVDFDAYAVPLDGLVRALGDEALVLYVGGERRRYEAHVDVRGVLVITVYAADPREARIRAKRGRIITAVSSRRHP